MGCCDMKNESKTEWWVNFCCVNLVGSNLSGIFVYTPDAFLVHLEYWEMNIETLI